MSYRTLAVTAAGVTLVAALAWWSMRRPGPPPLSSDDGRAVAAAFLDAARSGRVDEAWASTTTEFKSYLGRDGFRRLVRTRPALKAPAEFAECRLPTAGGPALVECVFRGAAPPRGGPAVITVTLAPEAGRWGVERVKVE
jgi:hypothetical protein